MTIQRPRGTRDFLPEESWRRSAARKAMQDVLERWGYQEICTPTFEHLELFTVKSGPSVVEEIYCFKDKGGRDIALRPELTAPVMRMYVSELQNAPKPQRLYYFGNCFRYERPQRGRFREFWQLGAELIGGARPDSEAEVIALADQMLRMINVKGDIHVGYLGLIRSILEKIGGEHRAAVMKMIDKKEREALKEYLADIGADHLGLLELIDLKGMGALDRAVEISRDLERVEAKEASASSTGAEEVSSKEGRASSRTGRKVGAELKLDEFQEMIGLLEAYGVSATIDFEIVRGLEYYSGTVFEIYAEGLGAQRQICGGGTYELSSLFGGAEISSTGFGLGFDRIMEIVELDVKKRAPVVIVYTPDVKAEAVKIAKDLRQRFPVVVDVMGRGLGAQLKAAASAGAKRVIIVGRSELDSGKLTLRDMVSGQQESLSLEEIEQRLGEEHLYL
ncbi:MAG TPA: histidine--tRNA ligase [Methanotrichaceae archaeon]|nr:histidine--tRNA ligase [Methanotrichaceae archaeon]